MNLIGGIDALVVPAEVFFEYNGPFFWAYEEALAQMHLAIDTASDLHRELKLGIYFSRDWNLGVQRLAQRVQEEFSPNTLDLRRLARIAAVVFSIESTTAAIDLTMVEELVRLAKAYQEKDIKLFLGCTNEDVQERLVWASPDIRNIPIFGIFRHPYTVGSLESDLLSNGLLESRIAIVTDYWEEVITICALDKVPIFFRREDRFYQEREIERNIPPGMRVIRSLADLRPIATRHF